MMHLRLYGVGLLLLSAAIFVGCGKSEPAQPPQLSTLNSQPVLRLHWHGKKQLAANPQAAELLAVLKLPETARLEKQTLDKLASAPWRLLHSEAAAKTAPVALLRPLLDDLVAEPTHLTVYQAAGQPVTIQLAVRLNATRAAVWQTNLPTVMRTLFAPNAKVRFELSRTNDWTVATLTPGVAPAFVAPVPSSNWLSADIDLAWLLPRIGAKGTPPSGWPRVAVNFSSGGGGVRTRADFAFAKPLELTLPPWNVPTNLIKDPLMTFTAVRGIGGWVKPAWNDFAKGSPPEQAFAWSLTGLPQLSFWAAPRAGSRDLVKQLTERLIKDGNPWLAAQAMGYFKRESESDYDGVTWADCAFMSAYLRSSTETGGEFVTGGLFPDAKTPGLFPAELYRSLQATPDLLAYDWELTGDRVDSLIYLTQLFRVIFNRGQLTTESAGIPWLKAIIPKLGNCVTSARYSAPQHVNLSRQSGLGLTAFELHLLVDWLESPQFPRGLHTFLVPGNPPAPR